MKSLDFKTAFKYPFNKASRMWNILWVFVPVVGWLVLIGYNIRIIKEFVQGKFKKLPKLNFSDDLELGFFMFIKAVPFIVVYVTLNGILKDANSFFSGIVNLFLAFFVVPMLTINFFVKETIASSFEFKILDSVFNNLKDYLLTLLNCFLIGITFLVMWVVLVGIPAGIFTKNIFLADFYRRYIKK